VLTISSCYLRSISLSYVIIVDPFVFLKEHVFGLHGPDPVVRVTNPDPAPVPSLSHKCVEIMPQNKIF
jgi:hypothetical protein